MDVCNERVQGSEYSASELGQSNRSGKSFRQLKGQVVSNCTHCGSSIALLENGVYVGCEHAPQASPDVLQMNAMILAALFMDNMKAEKEAKEAEDAPPSD